MDQSSDYDIAWAKEEQSLATKSITKIWLLAAIIIPFFAFLEIQNGMQQVLGFLYLALPLSFLLLFSVAFHKKIKLPPAVLTYSVSVIIATLFSFMAMNIRAFYAAFPWKVKLSSMKDSSRVARKKLGLLEYDSRYNAVNSI